MMPLRMQLWILRQSWFWKRLGLYALCYLPVCCGFEALSRVRPSLAHESSIALDIITAFCVIAFTLWINRTAMKRANIEQP